MMQIQPRVQTIMTHVNNFSTQEAKVQDHEFMICLEYISKPLTEKKKKEKKEEERQCSK